jgi:hypothetical protein
LRETPPRREISRKTEYKAVRAIARKFRKIPGGREAMFYLAYMGEATVMAGWLAGWKIVSAELKITSVKTTIFIPSADAILIMCF